MAAATSKGGIEEYLSTTTSKTTKDLQEVFSQLEQPSDGQYQRSILVEGSPGVGKSVLLKHIAYLWAQGELLTNTDFLFLLHLRDPSVQQMHSLDTLVHNFYHYDKQASLVTSCVAQDGGKSVTILLDGYDELPEHLRQNSFIADLLQHKVLPACSIVMSSRPHASTHLRDNISCQVEILGFSETDQEHFIEHSLKDQPHKISELKQYLKHHSVISNLCFIRFNMTILLFLYKDKEERPLPTSSTGLYNLFICLTICRHLCVKCKVTLDEEVKDLNKFPQPYSNIINQLSTFAFKALGNNQLVFTLDEIKKECPDIDKAINGFGLLQAVEYVGRTSKSLSFNFIHLSIQEFLAAHHVTTLPPSKELSIPQKNFWNNPVYFNMFDIYVALTNGQRPSFKRFLQPSLMEKFKKLFTGREEGPVGISKKLLNDKIKCLRMYVCFQEAGDVAMCKSIEDATQLDKQQIKLSWRSLSPSDLECLTIFLTCSSHKEWKELNLWGCIHDHGFQILQRGLRSSDVTITVLDLFFNNLTAVSSSAISDLTISCRVKKLLINYNKTVGEDDRLYRIITDDSSMVEELYMYSVNLSSSGAIKLFTALSEAKKLRELGINGNNITDEACDVIIMAMKKNTSLVILLMHNNPISGECAQLIVQALQYNNTLQRLYLNSYPGDVKEKIRSLKEEVNKKRKTRGCQVELTITFNFW